MYSQTCFFLVLAIVEIRYGQVYLSGGGLPGDRYQLLQFHFHWGNDSSEGSEHTYEGRPYPAEVRKYSRKTNQVGHVFKYYHERRDCVSFLLE